MGIIKAALGLAGWTSSAPVGWAAYYSTGVRVDASGSFDFPTAPGSIHYVLRPANSKPTLGITMRYRIDGDAVFMSTQDRGPGFVTLMIERAGDTLLADKPSYRFWAGSQLLEARENRISVPFDPR